MPTSFLGTKTGLEGKSCQMSQQLGMRNGGRVSCVQARISSISTLESCLCSSRRVEEGARAHFAKQLLAIKPMLNSTFTSW